MANDEKTTDLPPGWLARDTAKAQARLDQWSGNDEALLVDKVAEAIKRASEFPDPTEHEFFYRHVAKAAIAVTRSEIADEIERLRAANAVLAQINETVTQENERMWAAEYERQRRD